MRKHTYSVFEHCTSCLLLLLLTICWDTALAADSAPLSAASSLSPHSVSYNAGLYSQYMYRGMTQTAGGPAIQGGVDYSHAKGFYFGAWASNISWLQDNASYAHSVVEFDYYGGYANTVAHTDYKYNLGVAQYSYPGRSNPNSNLASPDTTELIGQLNYKWLTGIAHYTVSVQDSQIANARGSYYVEINADTPLAETEFIVNLHGGYQYYAGSAPLNEPCPTGQTDNNSCYGYVDWKIGITKSFPKSINVGAFYTFTNATASNYLINNEFIGKNYFTVYVQKIWDNGN